jgi:signal transduction histidine kinase
VSLPWGTRLPRPATILGSVRVGVLGGVLTAAAVAESAARAVWAPHTVGHNLLTESFSQATHVVGHPGPVIVHAAPASSALVLGLLLLVAVFTTVPLVFLGPTGSAVTIVVAAIASLLLFHFVTAAGMIALLVALYRLSRFAAPMLGAPFLVLALTWPAANPYSILLAALAPAAGFAGVALRERRAAVSRVAAQEDFTGSLLEHTARGERARIARELHDVVAHHISMVAVQAETARLTTPGMPTTGAARLLDIGDTARAALTEMRRLLGVLREDAPGEVADRRPQPSLAQLTTLLDESRAASGGGVRLIVSGFIAPLDPGVELAAYRIVQEALTNARRHAPGAAVDVELCYTDDALWLRIRDNGPGPSVAAAGHGLLGMRERAVAAGGSLRCGAAAGGGFLIEATLPGKAVAAEAAGGHGLSGMRERAAAPGGGPRTGTMPGGGPGTGTMPGGGPGTGAAPGGGFLIGAALPAEAEAV